MDSTRSPLQWRVLAGMIAGLIGVGVIGAALIFPEVTKPEALPAVDVSSSSSVTMSPTPEPEATTPPASVTPSASVAEETLTPPPTPAPSSEPEPEPKPAVAVLKESAPVAVRIPSLDVDASFVSLGLDGNELETPADPDVVGWFTGAHTPGGPGRAVLAGHLTWDGRNTVFARLPDVAIGAVVEVDREDGTTARFEVSEVSEFKKDEFPTAEVYASTDEPTLVLITCGGEYSSSEHYYDSNIIAYATALD